MNKRQLVFILAINMLALISIFSACTNDATTTPKATTTAAATDILASSDPTVAQLNQAISKVSDNPELYVKRAAAYYKAEGYDEAIADLNKAISLDSMKAFYYHSLADVYLDYNKSRLAINTMNKVVRLFPEKIPSLLKLSEFQLILRKNQECRQTILRILKIDPQNAEAYFMMGLNFKDLGDEDRALNSFQTAVENDPDHVDAWIELGQFYNKKDNPLALRCFDNAIRVDSSNVFALTAKGNYLAMRDKYSDAIEVFKKINKVDAQFADAYYNIGLAYLQMDSIKLAYDNFKITTRIEPLHYLAYYFRGQTYELQGNKDAAKKDYQQVLKLNPNFARAKEAIAKL